MTSTLAVARGVEAYRAQIATTEDVAQAHDVAQKALTEINTLLSPLDRSRLAERVDDALAERLRRDGT